MKKLIVANWKSNPNSLSSALRLAKESDKKGVVVAPPHVYLETIGRTLHNAVLGAQDMFWEDGGPYTGETSLSQLKNLKVKYVILGHSERREHLGETDEMINKKARMALKAGLKVILCVGEDLNTRKRGLTSAKNFVASQLKRDLAGVSSRKLKNLIVAYEPIWSISTSKNSEPDIPEESAEMAATIKNVLATKHRAKNVKVLYGGSVNSKNAKEFLSQVSIDGALVGGASLKPKEFKGILAVG